MKRRLPPQRFTIRRLSMGVKTGLPWCLYDRERPSYIGRFATWTEARNASVGQSLFGALLAGVRGNAGSWDSGLPCRWPS